MILEIQVGSVVGSDGEFLAGHHFVAAVVVALFSGRVYHDVVVFVTVSDHKASSHGDSCSVEHIPCIGTYANSFLVELYHR